MSMVIMTTVTITITGTTKVMDTSGSVHRI